MKQVFIIHILDIKTLSKESFTNGDRIQKYSIMPTKVDAVAYY